MRELGYLYVLANSAMPGLVKVGKTTRSPSERAGELSGVTGLPTPFIVVYEQLFEDCGSAESFVHAYLEQEGYRISDNREFFSAPVNLVVRAITLASGAIDESQPAPELADDFLERGEPDELDSLSISQSKPNYPWSSIFDEAEDYLNGYGDCIEDPAEALRLFRQAAKLGALPAYGRIGGMYQYGADGVPQDSIKSHEFYKEGALKGSAYCYWEMGMLFIKAREGEDWRNAEKCFRLFLQHMPALPDGQRLTGIELEFIFSDCADLLKNKVNVTEPPAVLSGFIAERASDVLVRAKWLLASYCGNVGDEETRLRKAIQYLETLQ